MNEAQKKKRSFRDSKKWKDFRKKKMKEQKVDIITGSKLQGRWNLHHCDLREKNYEDLSHEDWFTCLNSATHDAVHFLYRYYRKDKTIMERLTKLLELMYNIEEGYLD